MPKFSQSKYSSPSIINKESFEISRSDLFEANSLCNSEIRNEKVVI
jgi:hypothetical protein